MIPVVPPSVQNKAFTASDIKWIKNVNDRTSCAYIPPDKPYSWSEYWKDVEGVPENGLGRLAYINNDIFFLLQINDNFLESMRKPKEGDLILIYQRLNSQKEKCFTHLVTPISSIISDKYAQHPYAAKPEPPKPGRWVKVIAMTDFQVINSIPVSSTIWQDIGFDGCWKDLSCQRGYVENLQKIYDKSSQNQPLFDLQCDIWNRFQPYMREPSTV